MAQRPMAEAAESRMEELARQLLSVTTAMVAEAAASAERERAASSRPRPLLTIAQAAEHLQVSTDTLRGLIHRGELATVALGEATIRIDPADLAALVAARRVVQSQRPPIALRPLARR